ncbi:MAG: DUF3078 domain-containing protein [Balneolaceae bacterium]|nr:DUF3078 domain-containing protein [Balneolaceae bacterium]
MKRFLFISGTLFFILSVTNNAHSQAVVVPDTLNGWENTWSANLFGAQASYNNWSQGGVSTLSGRASTVYMAMYRDKQFAYGFRVNMKYGQSKVKEEGVRKTDDVIAVRNRFTYALERNGQFSAYGAVSLQTQFDEGYEYNAKVAGGDSLISNFFAPAYFNEGIGISYQPNTELTFEFGVGLKQTIVNDDSLTENYGLEPGDNFRSEGGLTTGITLQKEIMENVNYASSLETFTNLHMTIDKTDIMWVNELAGQINKTISASFQFEMRYDADFSSKLQLKQVLSAGVTLSIF